MDVSNAEKGLHHNLVNGLPLLKYPQNAALHLLPGRFFKLKKGRPLTLTGIGDIKVVLLSVSVFLGIKFINEFFQHNKKVTSCSIEGLYALF